MYKSRFARCALPLLLVFALLVPVLAAGCWESPARMALNKAEDLQEQAMLTRAAAEYERARKLFEEEGRSAQAAHCRDEAQSIMLVQASYPDLKADVEGKLAELYPQVPAAERAGWVRNGELERMTWDGKVHYFNQAAENIATRHFDVAYMNTAKSQTVADLVRYIESSATASTTPWQPYSNPLTWLGTESINVPRDKLPETGLLKLWFPLPVVMGPQNPVTVLSVTPDTWLQQPPSTTEDLADAYFEVPLDKLEGDLSITIQFQFTHYQENFEVDPANVGTYDRTSALYKEYTRSYGNIYISDEIRATAKKVAGGEKNPYLAAKKLYDYILKEIRYSYMPHMAAWPRGERESVYVHRMKRGDCGAQAMYFSALCRSLGIPARTTGGWQLFTGNFAGHFWAEFFLPNYGWLPVDPTAADISDWTDKISEQERSDFKEFYFGNQDPLRCNVQLDVDEALVPPLDGEVLVPLALQSPVGTCSTMEEPATIVISEYTTLSAQPLSGQAPPVSGSVH
ncbi:MAG: transglutaminase-like domain-containing protein [Actinobacteria bacterium]|nr:transglutaminase-like domain-containing protein [Actinomycetota bacterium]MBU1943981.1 transglutaminase-like domain-containing protein [Actinomycetota bacterium]MBU2688477.1 transglutaminase-like domain-containing protein [Actinomycetota bacterium]